MGASSSETQIPQVEHNILVAADQGRLDIVTKLLDGGTDPNTADEVGTTALHNAAKRGHWHVARLLLEKQASPGLEDGNYNTPLKLAIEAGHKKVIHLLLECDTSPRTSREICLAARCGHANIVQDLLDRGAPSLAPANHSTPLHVAAMQGFPDVCDVLLSHDKKLTRTFWERMTGPKLAVDTKGSVGHTPFSWAVTNQHPRTVEVFLRHYPSLVRSYDRNKSLCFHRAIELKSVEMVRVFLDHGADIEMRSQYGDRPLHRAVAAGDTEVIQMLLARGAAVDAKNQSGFIPEHLTNDPKIRMIVRNAGSARLQAKGLSSESAPGVAAAPPPPEYKA